MNIKPRNDVVLVKRLTPKYEGKLVLPDNAIEKPTEAVVVAVGPGAINPHFYGVTPEEPARLTIDLKIGDLVFIGRYAGMEIEESGEKLLFLREAEILGKRG
jgi:chaperonin GroES